MNNKAQQTESANSGQLTQEERSISIVDLIENFFYYRWHFVVTFVLITSLTLFYAILATPIYVADSLIQIDRKTSGSLGAFANQQSPGILSTQQSPIFAEIEIIKSRSVIGRAVETLQANITVSVANRLPIVGGLLSRILPKGSDGLVKPLWEAGDWGWGGEQLRIAEMVVPPTLTDQPLSLKIEKNEAWELSDKDGKLVARGVDGGLTVALDGTLRMRIDTLLARPGTRFRIVVRSLQDSIAQMSQNLVVVDDRRQTSLIKLNYQNANPAYAALVLNAITTAYVEQNIARLSEEAEQTLKFMNQELPKLRAKLDASEQELNEFRSSTKTIDVSSEIKEVLTKITMLDKMRFDLDMKKNEYAQRYDPAHPLMQAIKTQSDGLKAETAALNKQISQLPTMQQDYIRLARDVEIDNRLYVALLSNSQQLQITKAGITGTSVVIDRAVMPQSPSKPKKALVVAIGALAGLILGFALCQILGMISKVVRDPKKLEHETQLPTLAILPLDSDQEEHIGAMNGKVFLLAKEKPSASSVEALRSLRTSLLFKLSEKRRSKVVLITSAVPSQGKSFIAANLCYLMAASGKRTLLVEADIRLASIKRYVEYDVTRPGLSTVLRDNLPVENAILKDVYPKMDYLPAGPVVRNPGDLLAADSMNAVIDSLAELYDIVIIDSPPLLPVHDARSLGKSADVTLFVVRQDTVTVTEVHDAIDVFSKSGNTIDGTVFNGFVPSRMRYGYGYSYGYGYRRYGLGRLYGKRYGASYGSSYGSYGQYGGYGPPTEDSNRPTGNPKKTT